MRPEDALLLCCARIYTTESARAEEIKAALQHNIDWVYLLRRARSHAMMPLLHWHLNITCAHEIPTKIQNELSKDFRSHTGHNRFLAGELLELLDLFELRGVPVVPFKGPALAASLYGNVLLRKFTDLDLLVHKRDVLKAKDVLFSQGYRLEYRVNKAQEARLLSNSPALSFVRDGDGGIVDLHWATNTWSFLGPLDPEHLWQHLEPVSIGGREILTFSKEDLLVFLCGHATKHLWAQLGWLCDLARLIEIHPDLDWEQVVHASRGAERSLWLGLSLTHKFLNAPLPEKILKRVQADSVVNKLVMEVSEWLFQERENIPRDFKATFFHLRMIESLRDRLHYLIDILIAPTPLEWALFPLPSILFPFYYVLRPLRLAGKHTMKLLLGRQKAE